ncbi:MAG: hypothetical protein HC930_15790 [Hydrococcus sp. SU_1_0]|nr:hypothetical protein [Hydrococcus sp. SU_1_0]
MVKAKPNQKIHVNKLQTALDKLEQLSNKPVEEFTLRESIYFLRDKLNSALKKGYSYQDLSDVLSEQEILISAATLKQYLTDISKKSSSRKRKNQSSSIKSVKASQKTSTSVTDSQEDESRSFEDVQTNRIVKEKLAGNNQAKKATKSKPKVLSSFDDDLESEFNSF